MLEAEPPVVKQELTYQKPFVIRGHHLRIYIPLIKDVPYRKRATPAEEARGMRHMIEGMPSAFTVLEKPDGSWENRIPGFLELSQDVIGTSAESADGYEKRLRETFERFIYLPDDHPAELIEEMPDAICQACVVGEHCRSRSLASKIPMADMNPRESEHLDEFLKNITVLNLPEPVISYERAHFPDADPEQVRRIKTTIGAVRKVLKQTDPEIWT